MGFLDSLRGGGNKDGMRQTTSLTMAYLLEQNARFEAFMRQRVEELETIVTQQQARVSMGQEEALSANGEETWPEEDDWSQKDGWSEAEEETTVTAGDFGAAETTLAFAFSSATENETRPVPAMPVVGQFVLDDVVGFESDAPAGKNTSPSQAESTTLPSSLDLSEGEPGTGGSGGEPAEPPDWQAMLLGTPTGSDEEIELSEPDEILDREETQPQETPPAGEQTVDLAEETERAKPEEFSKAGDLEEAVQKQASGPDLVPDWLRRQQQEMLVRETNGTSERPESSGQQEAQKDNGPQLPDEKVEAAREEQAALPAEGVGDDEAWDTSLEATGPVGEWA